MTERSAAKPSAPPASFYGWRIVVLGFLLYGLGMAPAYYSWGFFAPEVIEDVGLTRAQIGSIFGAFTLTFAVMSMLSAALIHRIGIRVTVTCGALLCAVSWILVSRADSLADFYVGYAALGGLGIGLSTALPAQTLPVYWFKRYRARATAIILLGAAVFGFLINPFDAFLLERWGWRTAWVVIAGISLFVALIAALFIRNRPEDLGQRRDGRPADEDEERDEEELPDAVPTSHQFTVAQALRTPQFAIAVLADIANTIPWRVLTAHGRLHLENLGFAPTLAAAVLGVRVGMSGFGRLSGSMGDFFAPPKVLAAALTLAGVGVGGFRFAESPPVAYVCVSLLGIGYGAAFVTIPVVFSSFFGRRAFAGTLGLRLAITGLVGFVGPTWAGAAADASGSYNTTLVVLAAFCFSGAVLIFPCKPPKSRQGDSPS